MEKKTRIVVLHVKELIYTAIFIGLGIILILLLIFMFLPQKNEESDVVPTNSEYVAGVYSTSILLNGNNVDVEVVVDNNHINSIQFVNLSETVTTMYPLLQPALDNLALQVYESQSLEGITYPEENKYTSMVLLDAIEASLEKAKSTE